MMVYLVCKNCGKDDLVNGHLENGINVSDTNGLCHECDEKEREKNNE